MQHFIGPMLARRAWCRWPLGNTANSDSRPGLALGSTRPMHNILAQVAKQGQFSIHPLFNSALHRAYTIVGHHQFLSLMGCEFTRHSHRPRRLKAACTHQQL